MNTPKNITSEARNAHIMSFLLFKPVEVFSTGSWCSVAAACVTFVFSLTLEVN
jgi:hypothetical protein